MFGSFGYDASPLTGLTARTRYAMAARAPASAEQVSSSDEGMVLVEAACAVARTKYKALTMVDLDLLAESIGATPDGIEDYKKFLAI